MADDLRTLLLQAEHLRDAIFTPADVRGWPLERLQRLEAVGLVERAGHAVELVYDGGDHECVVPNLGFEEHPDDPARLICVHRCLNGCGRVVFDPHDFEQWRFSLLGLAGLVRRAIGSSGEMIEDVPGRLILVGTASIAGRVGEVFLGYGLARSDAPGVVACATRLAAAEYPAVLSVGVKPGNIWSVGPRPLTAVLAEHAVLGPEGLEVDLARIFPASGMVEVKPEDWITVTAAATLLLEVVSGIDLAKAKARVSKAAGEGRIRTNGKEGRDRRLDRGSFSQWQREQEKRDLDAWEKKHS